MSFSLPPTRGQAHSVRYLGYYLLLVHIVVGREKKMCTKEKKDKPMNRKEILLLLEIFSCHDRFLLLPKDFFF